MKNMMQRIRNRQGFTLVELMIVVAIIGILAAIAIPAFLRSVKKSKASEADGNVKKMMDGAKTYFTSGQKFVNPAKGGDQPWHDGSANNNVGYDVPWAQYVFPGGNGYAGLSTAAADGISAGVTVPTGVTTVDDIDVTTVDCTTGPTGGSKRAPFSPSGLPGATDPPDPNSNNGIELAILNKTGLSFEDPTYFTYEYKSNGTGEDASAGAVAVADFEVGGACHLMYQAVGINVDTQEVIVFPSTVNNEFE